MRVVKAAEGIGGGEAPVLRPDKWRRVTCYGR
jgi:hypothetical protein